MVCGGEPSPAFVSPLFDVASPGSVTVATELSPPSPPPPPAAASGATKADNLAGGGGTGFGRAATTGALALEETEIGAAAAATVADAPVDGVVIAICGGGISIEGFDATAVFIMCAGGGAIPTEDGIGATGVGSAVWGRKG